MKKLLTLLLFLGLSAVLVYSLAVLSIHRGEQVSALWVVTAAACTAIISYRFYSKWLAAKVLALDDRRAPPSIVKNDGKDYVPTNRWIVFGHHFAAIAGPGPLVGPVLASQFGYLPGLLWLLIGATLGGAVHDAVTLFCSIRRGGKSLGQMVKDEIGNGVGLLSIISTLAIMIILLAVLALVVVKALAESPWGVLTVAMTIPIAMIMGGGMRLKLLNLGAASVFGVVALGVSVWAGQFLHLHPTLDALFTRNDRWLAWAIMAYGLAASSLPVWLLLAPRDYLSSFLKLGTVLALAAAIVIIGPALKMPAISRFIDGTGPVFAGPVFPFVFITIACGAVSGFHSLIASGTTPKLVMRESTVRTIGYGAMITEMCVGVMALIAACTMEPGQYFAINVKGTPAAVVQRVTETGFPVTQADMQQLAATVGEKTMIGRTGGAPTFAVGMAQMLSKTFAHSGAMAIWYHFAIMFEALFILTTVDAGTRVGRLLLQNLLGLLWAPLGETRRWGANLVASFLLVASWGYFLYQGVVDPLGGINSLWPLFGLANQLLAVIALALGTTVLLKMQRVRYVWVTLIPLCFLTAVTFTAGWMKIFSPDTKIGFLSAARQYGDKIAAGGTPQQLQEWGRLVFNQNLDAGVAAVFLVMVALIVIGSALKWREILWSHKPVELRESEYVPLPEAAGAA